MQNYDGDDWGDESYDDEPEESPPPAKQIGLRQPGQSGQLSTTHSSAFMPPPRILSQPVSANPPRSVPGPAASPVPQDRPSAVVAAAAQAQSHFPPRKSSMSSVRPREGRSGSADPPAPRSTSRPESSSSGRPLAEPAAHPAGISATLAKAVPLIRPADIYRRVEEEKEKQRQSTESGRPSMDSIHSRGDGTSPANPSRSSTEQRRRTSFERDDGIPRSPRSTLAPVAERKSEYGLDRLLANAPVEADKGIGVNPEPKSEVIRPSYLAEPGKQLQEEPRRFSTSPKLPEMSRLSGFGDDFFANSIRFSSGISSPLQSVAETQPATEADPPKEQSSVLEGPKLEPNPNIILPSMGEKVQSGTSSTVETSIQQPTPSRPQLPGGWVSETSVTGPQQTTDTKISPGNTDINTPSDLAPTTRIKHLSSTDGTAVVAAEDGTAQVPRQDDFGNAVGQHDDTVTSKVISAGPGLHPTPHHLPPLKTKNTLGSANIMGNREQTSPPVPITTGPTSSIDVSQVSLGNPSNTDNTTSTFTPTAPLNPYRASVTRSDSVPDNAERKSTTSTIGTTSPLKESDKLREEIMKTLSPDPTNPSSSAEALTNPGQEQGGETRESRYLSGVYDDYLSYPEDKTLLETGRVLKDDLMSATRQTTKPEPSNSLTPQIDTSIPKVAPLSPKRTPDPEMEPVKRQRRFSWEQSPEMGAAGPTETKASNETDGLSGQNTGSTPTDYGSGQLGGSTSQPEGTNTPSQEPSKPSGYPISPAGSTTPDQASPISLLTNENLATNARRSLAEEKILFEPSSHLLTEHPALSRSSDPSIDIPRASLETPSNVTSQQPKIMAFREILNLPSTDQRTQKFDETRSQFFGMDSGLSNWLMCMKDQLEQTDVIPEGDQQTGSVAQVQPGSVGIQQSTQQPYYQQYLNASNPTPAMGPPKRTSTGNLLTQSGPNASGFNSGNQVGTKGKELLHAAGAIGNKGVKSGMKLFNKGKSKLRERANDKVFF